jgi:colicin import membrane protein
VARKLKTYQTSLGFYDLAIAAPSMKAALEAWGAASNLFHQGFAKETDDPGVVAATMAKPGVVLKRPAGSKGRFAEHADLPDLDEGAKSKKSRPSEPKRQRAPKIGVEDSRKAAAAYEREQKRRAAQRRKEEVEREKERIRREKLVAKAQSELDDAQREHEERSGKLEADRQAIENRIEAEDARGESEREKLKDALRRALG